MPASDSLGATHEEIDLADGRRPTVMSAKPPFGTVVPRQVHGSSGSLAAERPAEKNHGADDGEHPPDQPKVPLPTTRNQR